MWVSIGIILGHAWISLQSRLERQKEREAAEAKEAAHRAWNARYGARAGCYRDQIRDGFVETATGTFIPMERHVAQIDQGEL